MAEKFHLKKKKADIALKQIKVLLSPHSQVFRLSPQILGVRTYTSCITLCSFHKGLQIDQATYTLRYIMIL